MYGHMALWKAAWSEPNTKAFQQKSAQPRPKPVTTLLMASVAFAAPVVEIASRLFSGSPQA